MLTPKHKRFIKEYLIDLNASAAYLRAGYHTKNPDVMAAQLMADPEIKAAVEQAKAKHIEKLDISVERILQAIAVKAFASVTDFSRIEDGELVPDFSMMTPEQASAIQEFTVDSTGGSGDGERKMYLRTRFKLADSLRALELLGRYHKLFVDKVEHSVDDQLAGMLALKRRMGDGNSDR
jgi:phage terminase small subunit